MVLYGAENKNKNLYRVRKASILNNITKDEPPFRISMLRAPAVNKAAS